MNEFDFVKLDDQAGLSRAHVATTFKVGGTDFSVTVRSPEGHILLMIYSELLEMRKELAALRPASTSTDGRSASAGEQR